MITMQIKLFEFFVLDEFKQVVFLRSDNISEKENNVKLICFDS